ncbi:uncharacterized zinc finger CCHC domain-containing protein At4g19190 [Neltuma alba]|uniref:uncharacterized zinc finger CCHC domain-containing protein At4g19190 n=1 Tax=Neltuma alba TaxID=207710 RepID=UPI0010A53751|nr:uncharacterized zinc finger CCHC domain-containing protein At4g19190-like [Prosopis alba]XP_028755996.1 uncharacterized zinc finger CCHC domain-containing protein At4g19190-like [Prosopis alba]
MDGEEGGGIRLSKRFSDKGGEVDYKTKAGTAWSHSYLNQKPWHPLSYPNQRRKWIAEQTHAHKQRRAEEVAREYAQEQEFFNQTALISKKEKEKMEIMQAVSFMYVRPPGYNAESAKAAEMAEEKRREDLNQPPQDPNAQGTSSSMLPETSRGKDQLSGEKKKPRPKDVFGRPLPTEEEFEILKNAPRMDTGVAGRVKPFGVEVRNVRCLRCGNYGHQSGDRECPLKDAIMPNEENRLKRDDPLNAILAHTDPSEHLKWELKQKPGISPPRGGFNPDDPNQQIVAEEIFDEYGGFLGGGDIPELLTAFSKKPKKKSKKNKHKKRQSVHSENDSFSEGDRRSKKKKRKVNKRKQNHSESSSSDALDFEKDQENSRHQQSCSSEDSDSDRDDRRRKIRQKESSKDLDYHGHRSKNSRQRHCFSSEDFDPRGYHGNHKQGNKHTYSEESDRNSDDLSRKTKRKHSYSTMRPDPTGHHRSKMSRKRHPYSSEDDSGPDGYHGKHKSRNGHSYSSDDSDHGRQHRDKTKHTSTANCDSQKHHRHRYYKSRDEHSYTSGDFGRDRDDQRRKANQKHSKRYRSKNSKKGHSYSSETEDSGSDSYHRSRKGRS